MKSTLAILTAFAAVAAVAAFTGAGAAPASDAASATRLPQAVFYGHIKAMRPLDRNRFAIRFDPAWWLTGYAAERAKFEDTGSRDVPNDYYIVEEGHRLLSFVARRDAHVTVLTGGGPHTTTISAAELDQIVNGKNPRRRHLSEPQAGFWIRVGAKYPNPIVTLDQQYQA